MSAASAFTFGPKLCEALGLDANLVTNITLRCSVGDAVLVTVTTQVSQQRMQHLLALLTEYELVAREPAYRGESVQTIPEHSPYISVPLKETE